jgi:HPt (histidine-containing phosphotransfer) domain-containing protein
MGVIDLGKYKTVVIAITAFLAFVTVVLAANFQLASRFVSDAVAVRYVSQEQGHPDVLWSAAELLNKRLQDRDDISQPLQSLRDAANSFDATMTALATNGAVVTDKGDMQATSVAKSDAAQQTLRSIVQIWGEYKPKLNPVLRFSGSPYTKDQNGHDQLNSRGEELNRSVTALIEYAAKHNKQLAAHTTELTRLFQTESAARANLTRITQAVAIVVAIGLFVAILFYFVRNLNTEEAVANRARKETQDILRTVNEGLFLLDRELKIGTERSLALKDIFRRQDLDGLTFQELLRQIVPEKTLRTAMDYVALLWGERVNEKLVKTINPLNEVEVHFDNPAGGFDTHFLEFDFNRVRSEGSLSHLLVTVNDVTKRVMLARELQESQEKAQAQLDLLLRILHVEPESLTSFLSDSEVSLKMVNTILKEPAREEAAFRAKIDGIYRQIHAVKGESAALGLKTVEQRAHAFEESLSDLKQKTTLSGSDFLPLVVKLDDLFNHFAQVREMLSRLVDLHQVIATRRQSGDSQQFEADKVDQFLSGGETPALETTLRTDVAANALQQTLENLAEKIASTHSKHVALKCMGLERVPQSYKRAVKDITIQLVRNAVVHGIEAPDDRRNANKPDAGTLAVEFSDRGAEGFELLVQDDGRGLQLERIKEVAIERGIISPAQAALLDARQAMALIFRPGFSTADEVTSDAGRGAGMDLVRVLVAELGGRVGVASAGGRFAKFKIWLPATQRAVAA